MTGGTGLSEAEAQLVLEWLPRVLASRSFRNAPRSREFLALVVTETVAGRGDQLSERRIAQLRQVDDGFDPRTDPIIRIRARRVRAALQEHYAGEGRDDPVRISIPLGQYQPSFEMRPSRFLPPRATGATPTADDPLIAVLAFDDPSLGEADRVSALELAESIVHVLARCPRLRVVGPMSNSPGASRDPHPIGVRTGAAFVLSGDVHRIGHDIRVSTWLHRASTGELEWSHRFDLHGEPGAGFETTDKVLATIVADVGDFQGVVLREGAWREVDDERLPAAAVRHYYGFLDDLDPAKAPGTIALLQRALEISPDDSAVISALGGMYAIDVLMHGPAASPASLARADELGRDAVARDPTDPVAHFVLGIVALARGEAAASVSHARAMMAATPHHPSLTYGAGILLVPHRWDEGIALVRRSISTSPRHPRHRHVFVAIDDLRRGDVASALAQASIIRFPGRFWGPLLSAICLMELGIEPAARAEIEELGRVAPAFFENPRAVVSASPNVPVDVVDMLETYAMRLASLR